MESFYIATSFGGAPSTDQRPIVNESDLSDFLNDTNVVVHINKTQQNAEPKRFFDLVDSSINILRMQFVIAKTQEESTRLFAHNEVWDDGRVLPFHVPNMFQDRIPTLTHPNLRTPAKATPPPPHVAGIYCATYCD
eukprot:206041_1